MKISNIRKIYDKKLRPYWEIVFHIYLRHKNQTDAQVNIFLFIFIALIYIYMYSIAHYILWLWLITLLNTYIHIYFEQVYDKASQFEVILCAIRFPPFFYISTGSDGCTRIHFSHCSVIFYHWAFLALRF